MKIFRNIVGIILFLRCVKRFKPENYFFKKRIAVVGAANSVLDQELGSFIDEFDYVIRINKALITYNPANEKFIGKKTDILIHNFHENMDDGGGGPIDWDVFSKFNLTYLIQGKSDISGLRNVFNYFKKYLNSSKVVYTLPRKRYSDIKSLFGTFTPTRGFIAIYLALNSGAEEVYLTGFTFFKSAYADGYRDNIKSVNDTLKHIERQGFHNADLEFENFKKILLKSNAGKIYVDEALYDILKSEKNLLTKDYISCKVSRVLS